MCASTRLSLTSTTVFSNRIGFNSQKQTVGVVRFFLFLQFMKTTFGNLTIGLLFVGFATTFDEFPPPEGRN